MVTGSDGLVKQDKEERFRLMEITLRVFLLIIIYYKINHEVRVKISPIVS